MSNSRLVWSDDPKENQRCSNCREFVAECRCPKQESSQKKFTAVFRLEKGGRGGKTVTVIDQLPKNEQFLKDLCKDLKARCGAGGTYKLDSTGLIEIQGDQRANIKAYFDKKGISYKGM